jgi:hypothetical protein
MTTPPCGACADTKTLQIWYETDPFTGKYLVLIGAPKIVTCPWCVPYRSFL